MEENPYKPPEIAVLADEVYYGCDTTKLTFAECWRFTRNPFGFLLLAWLKCFRVGLPVTCGIQPTSKVNLIDDDQVAWQASETAKTTVAEAESRGFVDLYWHADMTLGNVHSIMGELRSTDGGTLLGVSFTKTTGQAPMEEDIFFFMSRFAEGDWIVTANNQRKLNVPELFHAEYMPGGSMEEVQQRHGERLQADGREPEKVLTRHRMGELTLERAGILFDYHRQRGYFRQLSPLEVDKLRNMAPQEPVRFRHVHSILFGVSLASFTCLVIGIFHAGFLNLYSCIGFGLLGVVVVVNLVLKLIPK